MIEYGATNPDADAWLDSDETVHADTRSSLLGGIRSGKWLDNQEFPALRYTVPGIIPEGTTVFAGAPKVGKSWAVFHIGLAVAAGDDVFDALPVGAPRPVLYLALEDGWRRLQGRARSLLAPGQSIPDALDVLIEVEHGMAVETIAEWLTEHGGQAPLVIVDTLGRVMPRSNQGESAYERDYRAVTQFKRLADAHPGSSLVIVHHTRKMGSDDFVDGVSGTLGITGSADTTVVLTRSRTDSGGLLKVTGRDIVEAEYSVDKSDNGAWSLTGGTLDASRKAAATERVSEGLGDRSAEILRTVAEYPDGIGPTALGKQLDMKPNAAGEYLKRLADAGRLQRAGRGSYRSVDAAVLDFNTVLKPRSSATRPFNTFNAFNGEPGEDDPASTDPGVETVETVETATCDRCRRPSDEPLIAGRCRRCAYPSGTDAS